MNVTIGFGFVESVQCVPILVFIYINSMMASSDKCILFGLYRLKQMKDFSAYISDESGERLEIN